MKKFKKDYERLHAKISTSKMILSRKNLFFIFIGSIGCDLLIGDPKYLIHPVQIIGIYIKKITNLFIFYFEEKKSILFWGGLFIALSSIGISFLIGKIIELSFLQSKNNFLLPTIYFFSVHLSPEAAAD